MGTNAKLFFFFFFLHKKIENFGKKKKEKKEFQLSNLNEFFLLNFNIYK